MSPIRPDRPTRDIPTPTPLPGIDHVALGISRVVKQYQEAANFLALLAALLKPNNELEQVLQGMFLLPDVDRMTGVNLDVIGRIVGVSRYVPVVVNLKWFGFADTGFYADVFGEEGIPNIGSRFFEEGESYLSTTVLADPEYRFLIKAKIVKNSSAATCEDIIRGLQYMFNTLDVHVTDNLNMSVSISIGRPLFNLEQAMVTTLDILPRPAGVRIAGSISSYVPPAAGYVGGPPPYDGTDTFVVGRIIR